jgi:type III restriction enzyme
MRLCVNQHGERMDHPATAHDINVLTVVANESYEEFVKGLQSDIHDSLSARPRKANEGYFTGKVLVGVNGEDDKILTPELAKQIYRYLLKNDYSDDQDHITDAYHLAKKDGTLAELPDELAPHAPQVFQLIDSVFSEGALPQFGNNRAPKRNILNENFHKKEFQDLWRKINHKAAYTVAFETDELIAKAIKTLNAELRVEKLRFQVVRGEQADTVSPDELAARQSFVVKARESEYGSGSIRASVSYDLIGTIAEATQLTRRTVAAILQRLELPVFGQFKSNPEAFISRASTLIKEQKATMIIEHLSYDPIEGSYDSSIFTAVKNEDDFGVAFPAKHHIYDYVFTDSKVERKFAEELDTNAEVKVYAKLPKGFSIPTPVGDYNPDWAIAFDSGKTRHVFFIAETKGSMSSLELREIEKARINCARKFFARITSDEVRYDVVNSYEKLMELVK